MRCRVRSVVALTALATALVVAGSAIAAWAPAAKPPKPKTTAVKVSMIDFGFKLSSQSVPSGTVVFTVVNDGKVSHDFALGNSKIPVIEAGQSATLTVRLSKPGKFTYLCTVEGHVEQGMIGSLTVT